MNIYLAASTERINAAKPFYKRLLSLLRNLGYDNTNEYLNAIILNKNNPDKNLTNIHRITRHRIKQSVLLICDISDPSITLGTLIEFAITDNIPVLCICDNKKRKDLPTILRYYDSQLFSLVLYDEESIDIELDNYFKKFRRSKIKLNVFITPEVDSYMKWHSKRYNSSKSDMVRDLLDEKMKTDKEYQKTILNNSNGES